MSLLRIAGLKCHSSPVTCSRDLFLNYTINGRKRIIDIVSSKIKTNLKQSIARKCDKPKQVSYIVKLSCGSLVLSYILKSRFYVATCRASKPINGLAEPCEPLSFKWKHLLKYLYPHFWYLLVAISSALIVAVLNIWIPQCVGGIINVLTEVCKQKQSESSQRIFAQLAKPALKLARMYASQALFTFVYIFSLSHMGEKLAAHLRRDLFKSIIMQDIAFFDKNRSGEIVSRLTTDIQDFKSTFKICISQGIRSVTQIIGCVISVIVISPKLTAAMVLSVPSIIFIGTLLGTTLHKLSLKAQNQIAKSTAICEETIQNIKTVRAFAAENKETEQYSKEVELSAVLYEQLGFGIGLFQAGANLFLNGILLSTLYFGGHLMSTGQLSPGDLMAFLMATQTIQRSLSQLSTLFGSYVRGISAGARVFEYLDMPPSSMMIGGESIEDKSLMGNIIFKNVEFSYPTRPDQVILKNFNLHVPAGETVAIVGSSGNGKSTVAALLERFYDVDDGSITIDGRDIRSLNSSYLRGNVLGYIDQEPILFATSIMENIRYGKLSATDSEVVEAAKQANAHGFIVKFPNGYNTEVGERGTQLSGGQKQRVAIARALLKHPSILILDEATSALDYESERVVQSALEHAAQGRTVLVIAHRLSTIKNADLIVVLQRGVIVEMGTHADLIKKKGTYYTLVNEQENENV